MKTLLNHLGCAMFICIPVLISLSILLEDILWRRLTACCIVCFIFLQVGYYVAYYTKKH